MTSESRSRQQPVLIGDLAFRRAWELMTIRDRPAAERAEKGEE
jgi:hypothetical protein